MRRRTIALVAAALALFTDDAVIDAQSGLCVDKPCVGKEAIRKELVTRFKARSGTIQSAGLDRIVLWSIREMRDGKIASIRCGLPERTDS